jgi:hypothetical protein
MKYSQNLGCGSYIKLIKYNQINSKHAIDRYSNIFNSLIIYLYNYLINTYTFHYYLLIYINNIISLNKWALVVLLKINKR